MNRLDPAAAPIGGSGKPASRYGAAPHDASPHDASPHRPGSLAAARFLAGLESLRTAPSASRPALDAALIQDAGGAARHLAYAGERWERVLSELGRERDTYEIVGRLLADPVTRDLGAGLGRAACQTWRAAAVELLPLLVRYRGQDTGRAMTEALTTASVSRRAVSAHGDLLAGIGFTPAPRPRGRGRGATVYDAASAAELLAAKPMGLARLPGAPRIFGALLDAGPLTFRQAAQLYGLTFERPGHTQGVCAPLWLRHAGPSALPRLLGLMVPYLDDYAIGEFYLEGLAGMGGQALPALPAVTALIERRTRIPTLDSTRDGEMMLDETLLKAALDARSAILADGAGAGAGAGSRAVPVAGPRRP